MRQIFLDTETTGLDPQQDRIIEIGAVELADGRPTGRTFHTYVTPQGAPMDPMAHAKHGIGPEQLATAPRFMDVAGRLLMFVRGAEVLAHFAEFDAAFIQNELDRLAMGSLGALTDYCTITCTRQLATGLLPDLPSYSLDALCDHYGVDRSHRVHHGALVDAALLAAVYAAMCSDGPNTRS